MDLSAMRGPVAIVAIDLARTDQVERPRASVVGAIRTLAEPSRGHVLADADDCLVVFAAAPRAVDFALRVHDEVGGRLAVGVHVGEVHERGEQWLGAGPHVARAIARAADDGETFVSGIVHDIVRSNDDVAMEDVSRDRTLPGDLPPVRLLRRAHAPAVDVGLAPPRRLVDRLATSVATSRLTVVTAGQGMGKSTLARAVAEARPTVWLTVPAAGMRPAVFARELVDGLRIRVPGIPALLSELTGGFETDDPDEQRSRAETLAATVVEAVSDRLPRDLLVVVDGIERLTPHPVSLSLLEALARNSPESLHLLLLGRRDPGLRTERLVDEGRAQAIAEDELRLTDDEIVHIVRSTAGATHVGDGAAAVRLAAGQPEVARLIGTHLRRVARPLPDNVTDLVQGLLAECGDAQRIVIDALAALGTAPRAVLTEIARLDAIDTAGLVADGLVRPVGLAPDRYELAAAVAGAAVIDDETRRRWCAGAARALLGQHDVAGALAVLTPMGGDELVIDILRDHGRRLLSQGGWPVILDAIGPLAGDPAHTSSERTLTPQDAGLIGEAWRLAGDRDRALAWFEHAADALDDVPAWLAWRLGILLHFGGELDRARALYARTGTDADADSDATDLALLRSWEAAAAWLQSDIDACRPAAEAAMHLAQTSGDEAALAAAHTVAAMVAAVDGDRAGNDQHYLRAMMHAERAGDVLQLVRIHTNRGSRLLEEGEHAESLAELELALKTADFGSALSLTGMALSNRGQVLRRLGRLDEATSDLVASRAIFERIGSRWVSYALANLGEIYDVRGERSLAFACYEEAILHSEPVGDTQGLVPAYAGLARLMIPQDLDRAQELAAAACAHPEALGHVEGLAAMAEVALEAGDLAAATDAVERGLAVARQRRDRPGIATHLELRARIAGDDELAQHDLEEARALWAGIHCPLEEARAIVALAGSAPSPESRRKAERALRTLRSLGARTWAESSAQLLRALDGAGSAPIHVDVLGTLRIRVAGAPLPEHAFPGADALEFLVRAVAAGAGHRSSVGSGAVGLLDDTPDRNQQTATVAADVERFLAEHGAANALSPDHAIDPSVVTSDLHAFLSASEHGLLAFREGATGEAAERLGAAEAMYGGTLLEGRVTDPWLALARDDAAEAYLQVVMALVDLAEQAGDNHGAVRLLLRVIERDPYDEGAHLRLVGCLERAGRRGESRRRYRLYTARMQEIGVEPAPFPDVKTMVPSR